MTSSMLSVPTIRPTEPVLRTDPGQPGTELAPVRRLTLAPAPGVRGRRVSERERDVLTLVADGHSTREVARRLCYSERTIKNILQDVTSRLELRNRTQAIAYAIRSGWI